MYKKPAIISLFIVILLSFNAFGFELSEWWAEDCNSYDSYSDSPLLSSYATGMIVDWHNKKVFVKGRSAINGPMTLQNREKIRLKAEKQAFNTLINSIGYIRVNGFLKLSDIIDTNYHLRSNLEKLIQKTYKVVHEKIYDKEEVIEATIEFNLVGKSGLTGTFFPEYLKTLPSSREPDSTTLSSFESNPEAITGLIIDASGLGVEGGLSINVVDEDGIPVYLLDRQINKGNLIISGFVDYIPKSERLSDAVSRAGKNPLEITAKSKLKSPYNCDIVITREDAERIKNADAESDFLRDLNVVVLL